MANEPSPICFRVTGVERNLLDAVAYHQGESLSAFVRNAVIAAAQGVLETEGREAVLRRFEEVEARRSSRGAQERLKDPEEAPPPKDLLAEVPRVKRRSRTP